MSCSGVVGIIAVVVVVIVGSRVVSSVGLVFES